MTYGVKQTSHSVGLIYLPYTYPPAAANMIIRIGDTFMAHIANAHATGIQQLLHPIFAVFAILNVGTAMSATTAGRMPRNMAAQSRHSRLLVIIWQLI